MNRGLFNASDEDGDVDLNGLKLDSSVGYFKVYAGDYDYFDDANEDYFTNVYFTLETSSDIYETKEYDVVVRHGTSTRRTPRASTLRSPASPSTSAKATPPTSWAWPPAAPLTR